MPKSFSKVTLHHFNFGLHFKLLWSEFWIEQCWKWRRRRTNWLALTKKLKHKNMKKYNWKNTNAKIQMQKYNDKYKNTITKKLKRRRRMTNWLALAVATLFISCRGNNWIRLAGREQQAFKKMMMTAPKIELQKLQLKIQIHRPKKYKYKKYKLRIQNIHTYMNTNITKLNKCKNAVGEIQLKEYSEGIQKLQTQNAKIQSKRHKLQIQTLRKNK